MLSRVDGGATVADITDLSSLEVELFVSTLEKLVGVDTVQWANGTTSLRSRSAPPPASRVHLGVPVRPHSSGPVPGA